LNARKTALKNAGKSSISTPQSKELFITLSAEDYEKAKIAAKYHDETVEEWISGLVNTALQP
jgi:hypothetical protein